MTTTTQPRDYVTSKATGIVHLMSQNPIADHTLCMERVSLDTHEWGDETLTGIAATCPTCIERNVR